MHYTALNQRTLDALDSVFGRLEGESPTIVVDNDLEDGYTRVWSDGDEALLEGAITEPTTVALVEISPPHGVAVALFFKGAPAERAKDIGIEVGGLAQALGITPDLSSLDQYESWEALDAEAQARYEDMVGDPGLFS